MNKTRFFITLGLTIIFLMVYSVFAVQCDSIQEIANIPCEVQTSQLNCSGNVSSLNTFNSSISQNYSAILVDPACTLNCIYNFTFNQTDIGTYKLTSCNNNFALISVVTERTINNQYLSTSGASLVGSSINVDLNGTIKQQLVSFGYGAVDYVKVIFLRFWWLAILLILVLFWFARPIVKKHQEKKHYKQQYKSQQRNQSTSIDLGGDEII